MESILDSIKYMLGGQALVNDVNFDSEIILHTNGALMILSQLGVGPLTGFTISSSAEQWTDLIGDRKDLELIKTDAYLRVRLMFDPPQNSFLVKSIEDQIKEYDWRIELAGRVPNGE